ncbi:MAG: glycerol-3-phosphate responsive antiterminator [Bacilli bacterium]|nr:glycerol-3-phosphate responsive antiterminator [Bacilli bacterium]MBN2876577.1 glycerol-3-phosphate responsive antiterminator [Bacilli bacterium]
MKEQRIIPAISDYKKLDKFLKSDLKYGILMNFQLAQLEDLIHKMKQHQKKVLIHSELIRGLSSDEYGAIYLIQSLHIDGIISSKPKVIEICKKRGIIGIYRFFIKDTISLDQSLDIGKRLKPDFVEILPASSFELVQEIKEALHCEVLLGGLIRSKGQLDDCFSHGAIAVTSSDIDLWEYQ